MEWKVMYLCDPGKNKKCRKTGCFYEGWDAKNSCFATLDPECAVTGPEGLPLALPIDDEDFTVLIGGKGLYHD